MYQLTNICENQPLNKNPMSTNLHIKKDEIIYLFTKVKTVHFSGPLTKQYINGSC